jgi:hypothetical protein
MKVFWFLLFTLLLSSCTQHYLDALEKGNKEPVKSNFFEIYSDYNIFRYQSNVAMTRDTEKIYPKHFEVRLPKNIVHWEINNITDFGFYYDHGQVVFIKLKLENAMSKPDSIYTPSRDELTKLIEEGLSTSGNKRYDIKGMKSLTERKNLIVDKGNALIILYNIKADALDDFSKEIKEFKFLN